MELQVVVSDLDAAALVTDDAAAALDVVVGRLGALDPGVLGPRVAPALGALLSAASGELAATSAVVLGRADALRTTARDLDTVDEQVADALHLLTRRLGAG